MLLERSPSSASGFKQVHFFAKNGKWGAWLPDAKGKVPTKNAVCIGTQFPTAEAAACARARQLAAMERATRKRRRDPISKSASTTTMSPKRRESIRLRAPKRSPRLVEVRQKEAQKDVVVIIHDEEALEEEDEDEEDEEYVVDMIVDERSVKGQTEYLTRWKDYDGDTWEPAAHLKRTNALKVWLANEARKKKALGTPRYDGDTLLPKHVYKRKSDGKFIAQFKFQGHQKGWAFDTVEEAAAQVEKVLKSWDKRIEERSGPRAPTGLADSSTEVILESHLNHAKKKTHVPKRKKERQNFTEAQKRVIKKRQDNMCNLKKIGCSGKLYVHRFEFDHIDGDPSNNDTSNGQAICMNCHGWKTENDKKLARHGLRCPPCE